MADTLPKIRITDPHSHDTVPLSASPSSPPPVKSGEERDRSITPTSTRSKSSTVATASPSKQRKGVTISGAQSPESNGATDMGESQAPIDPLSQQIFRRTNTPTEVLKQFGPSSIEPANVPRPYTSDGSPGPKVKDTSRSETVSLAPRDKKKGVSFLSRIIGNKKKDDGHAHDEDHGEFRPEGIDAELFSQPIDNMGYSPRYPQPPGYIKIRSRFKRERQFDRLFLAQELHVKSPPQPGQRPATSGGLSTTNRQPAAATNNPIWALEFSKDGRYLAVGGQDKVVRVWAVISSPEERTTHEKAEVAANKAHDGQGLHLSAPVFQKKTFREYTGHESTILDLSWSKNNFLLSSSMDKTVRLWHISRAECLCTFKHADFVPSIQFHPKDDRFFLAGSLDSKLRLWSIPDKSVAYWNQLPEMITAVAFTPDGKTAIAGTLSGLCLFYDTEGLKYQTQIHVKSSRGKNAKGSKITGIQAMQLGPDAGMNDLKLLVSSNDSRIRLYSFRDKNLDIKFRGQQNNFSQIRATFSDDGKFVICGSEDRKAYIWSTGPGETENRNQQPVEMFDAHASITTCAILAPTKTRQLLSNSEDPLYDLCNPPPITLMSKTESIASSSVNGDLDTPTPYRSTFRKAPETPAYIARSAHSGGQIIVTADYTGQIKVFRQDCAWNKRRHDNWETSSVFSKRTVGSGVRRSNSTKTKASARSRRDSTSTMPSADRILSWRQHVGGNGSISGKSQRSGSPSKSSIISSARSSHARVDATSPLAASSINDGETASPISPSDATMNPDGSNPMWIKGDQSYAYYNPEQWRGHRLQPPPLYKKASTVSRLSSEDSSYVGGGDEQEELECKECGGTEFKAIAKIEGEGHTLLCRQCGVPAT